LSNIVYPYIPEGRVHKYVGIDNKWMALARQYAQEHSLEPRMPNCSVLVRGDAFLAFGANGSSYHTTNGCDRARSGSAQNEAYESCEGCHPKNHGEPKAIAAARELGHTDLRGADVYMWGHWFCCQPCWDLMLAEGINDVYLLEGSERLFNRHHPENVVGRQFTYDR